jgi:hypothetical protein
LREITAFVGMTGVVGWGYRPTLATEPQIAHMAECYGYGLLSLLVNS